MQDFSPVDDAATLIQHTDPVSILVDLEHQLRGEVYAPDNKKSVEGWFVRETPLLNNKGINKIMLILRGVVNTNCILSNLDAKEVSNIIIDIGEELSFLLAMEYEEYDIRKANLTTIVNLCCRMYYFALKRGFNEGERRFLRMSVRENVSVTPNAQEPKRGLFGKVFKK